MSKVDTVYQGWLNLSEAEQQELLQRLQRDADLMKQGMRREAIKKSFDLGPVSQGHCACCGR